MGKWWMPVALFSVLWWSSSVMGGDVSRASTSGPVTLETMSQTYTTPQSLTRFLREAITLITDQELFGDPDYWQAPEEFLSRRAGDCEDYALLAQAVLQRQGIEAHVFSLFGTNGYAHTVCVFREAGRWDVINQDVIQRYHAVTLAEVADQLYAQWTYGALAQRTGTRGVPRHIIRNSHRTVAPASWRSDSLYRFP